MKPLYTVSNVFLALLGLLIAPGILIFVLLERRRHQPFPYHETDGSARVAYLITDLWGGKPGGATSHKIGFCKGLLRLGHVPTVLANQPVPGLEKVVQDFHIIPPPFLPKRLPLTVGVLANNLIFARRASSILKQLKPDVVCQRHSKMNYSGVLLSRRLKVPFILEYNSPSNWKAASEDRTPFLIGVLSRFIERINLAAADRIMVVSRVLKQHLVDRGVAPEKVAVNPNGADAELFRPDLDPGPVRQRLHLENKIVVAFAGHHNARNTWHGVKYLVMAVKKVAERRKDVQFLFIGDQGLVDLVLETARAESTTGQITFATSISHRDMPSYYAACDVLVSPHVHMADGSTFFGSPVKVFEYMAMGKPIVASGIGQLGDLLKGKALLTEPGDVVGIADAILTLAGDADLRRQLGAAARETCINRLTWKHNAERFINAYREVLEPPAQALKLSEAPEFESKK
jgi:glycosyltransferase involved in cell wall biosynthesis